MANPGWRTTRIIHRPDLYFSSPAPGLPPFLRIHQQAYTSYWSTMHYVAAQKQVLPQVLRYMIVLLCSTWIPLSRGAEEVRKCFVTTLYLVFVMLQCCDAHCGHFNEALGLRCGVSRPCSMFKECKKRLFGMFPRVPAGSMASNALSLKYWAWNTKTLNLLSEIRQYVIKICRSSSMSFKTK